MICPIKYILAIKSMLELEESFTMPQIQKW